MSEREGFDMQVPSQNQIKDVAITEHIMHFTTRPPHVPIYLSNLVVIFVLVICSVLQCNYQDVFLPLTISKETQRRNFILKQKTLEETNLIWMSQTAEIFS